MPVYEEKEKVNGQKRYFVRVYITDSNGKKKQIKKHNKNWVGRDGKKEAEAFENSYREKIFNSFEEETFGNLSNDFFGSKDLEVRSKTLKESTYLKHLENYNNHLKEFFSNKKVFKISTLDIKKWKEYMLGKDLALNTRKNAFCTLSAMLQYAVEYYGMEKNPARIAKNFKAIKGQKKNIMKFVTSEQFEEAIKFEDDFIYYVAFNLLFYTGIRRGEMLSINKYNDLDFENNIIRIDETVNPKISMIPTPPKTDKSNREIEVLPEIMQLLKIVVDNDKSEDGYIFLHSIKLTTLKRRCDNMFTKIGFEKNDLIRIHDFRHSFASLCINNGVEIQILSEYMGHENISITWDTYGHLYPNSQKKLLNTIHSKIKIENHFNENINISINENDLKQVQKQVQNKIKVAV